MKVLNAFEFAEGRDKVEFEATDSTGKSWTFGLSKKNKACHPHPKLIISSGWRAYVQAKGLKMNDRVTLYDQQDKPTRTRFKIRAERKVPALFKLLGKEIEAEHWVDVEKLNPDVTASVQCTNGIFQEL